MIAIGIDVGINGGLAAITDKGAEACVMPIIKGSKSTVPGRRGSPSKLNGNAIRQWIFDQVLLSEGDIRSRNVLIAIEAQQAMPKQGLVSTMHLGESFGILQGIVIGLQLPLVLVKPKQWKKTVLADTPMDKSAAINYVIQRYPKIDMNVGTRKVIYHDGIADAVCIADHAMRYMTVGGLAASAETYEDSEAENEAADAELDKENEA